MGRDFIVDANRPVSSKVNDISFSDDGQMAVFSETNGLCTVLNCDTTTKVFEFNDRKVINLVRILERDQRMFRLLYTTTAGNEALERNAVRLYRHDTKSYDTVFFGHEDKITSLAVNRHIPVFTTTGNDKRIFLWDTRSPHPAMEQIVQFNGLLSTWSKCGRVLATSYKTYNDEYIVELFDFNKLSKGPIVREAYPAGNEIWTNLEYSSDNKFILISTNGSYLKLLSSYNAKQIGSDLTGHLHGNVHNGPVRGAFLDDEIICGGSDNQVHCWSYSSNNTKKTFSFRQRASARVLQIAPNPSFHQFYCFSADNVISSWMAGPDQKLKQGFYESESGTI